MIAAQPDNDTARRPQRRDSAQALDRNTEAQRSPDSWTRRAGADEQLAARASDQQRYHCSRGATGGRRPDREAGNATGEARPRTGPGRLASTSCDANPGSGRTLFSGLALGRRPTGRPKGSSWRLFDPKERQRRGACWWYESGDRQAPSRPDSRRRRAIGVAIVLDLATVFVGEAGAGCAQVDDGDPTTAVPAGTALVG